MRIGGYECQTPLATAGSGGARWCVAAKEGRRFFIKQFLTPVQPPASLAASQPLYAARLARCAAFEARKRALYHALQCVLGDCVVPVADFFAFEGRYYAASEYIPTPFETIDTLGAVSMRTARELLFALALCLGSLHAQGIVHADLKPEHVLLTREGEGWRVRLIDFDSGFLEHDPPTEPRDIEGDPVYRAPETYLRMTGKPVPLTRQVDTFAFAAIAQRLWAGNLPAPATPGQTSLYEAALSGGGITLSDQLPTAYQWLVRKALSPKPEDRPPDALLQRLLAPPADEPRPSRPAAPNSLTPFLRPDAWRL